MYKVINTFEMFEEVLREGRSYMLVEVTPSTTIEQITAAHAFITEVKDEVKEEGTIEKAVDKAVPETPEKPKPAPRIDVGKLGALYRAGWEPKKIADELGCSTQTVRNYIAKIDKGEI